MQSALIIGVTGQDGSIMTKYLLKNTDLIIYGGVRRLSVGNHYNIKDIKSDRFRLIDYDASDSISIENAIRKLKPDYVVNFAANSFVGNSWDMPFNHFQVNTISVIYLLEAIRKFSPETRFYQASSSEMFGDISYSPQDENHPLKPCSPYGVSKCASHLYVKMYRESYGIYAVNGVCFNHGSPVRGKEFVERKISLAMADFYDKLSKNKYSDIKPLKLGNIYSERDWSHAEDIIDGIWRMLNQDVYNENISSKIKEKIKIDNIMRVVTRQEDLNELIIKNIKDYVVSSGKTCSIKFILEKFFKMIGVFGYWSGEKLEEKFYATSFNGKEFSKKIILVEVDEKFYRPLDVQHLCGDSSKIRKDLGWEPKYNIDLFVKDILDSDIKNYAKE